MSRSHLSRNLIALLALAICTGTMQAATLAASATTITLPCDTVLGPTPVQVGIKLLLSGSYTVTPTVPALSAISLSGALTVNSTTNYSNFTISAAAGCKGIPTSGTPPTVVITFTPTGGSGLTALTVTATLSNATTANGSALAANPSPVTITCDKTANTSIAVPVNVFSSAYLGTPYTVTNTNAWLTLTGSGAAAGTANIAGAGINMAVNVSGTACAGLPVGTTTGTIQLLNPPAAPKTITVYAQVGATSTLTPIAPISMVFAKDAASTAVQSSPSIAKSGGSNVFFNIDTSTLPVWLNVSPLSGTTPQAVGFSATVAAQTLAPGTYSAGVHVKVSGQVDLVIPVNLQVTNGSSTVSVVEGISRTINWTIGTSLPTLVITPISSDSPIAFTVTASNGAMAPQFSPASGVAYSFGTPISISFLQSAFAGFSPGLAAHTGTVTITPATGGGSAITVTITLNVYPPVATITSITPNLVPTATTGSFTVTISGNGFQSSTVAGIVKNGSIVLDPNVVSAYSNPTTMILTITLPTSPDAFLAPFSAVNTVILGVCNSPNSTVCSTPTGNTANLSVGVNPIIQAVTSSSSYLQAQAPQLTPVAAYDMLSIFGKNFCVSGGTGCTGSIILYGQESGTTMAYPSQLSPDTAGNIRNLTVTFQTHANPPQIIGVAPLLFATNSQINLLVPSAVANPLNSYIGQAVDIVVSFGYGVGATMLTSAPYTVQIAANDPGIFTMSGDGQGNAAALLSDGSLISQTNPAGISFSGATDTIQLYVTGLGRPDSDGTGSGYSATCISADNYWPAVNTASAVVPALTSDDGLVIQSSLFSGLSPCIKSSSALAPVVTVGNLAASAIGYAGWVSGAVAGLSQINVPLLYSASLSNASGTVTLNGTAQALPISISANGKTSPLAGVNLWVVRRLSLPATLTVTGTSGGSGALANSPNILPADGTSTFTYAYLQGTALPAGVTLDSTTGDLAGTPSAPGTTVVVIKVTDSTASGGALTATIVVTFNIS